MARVTEQDIIAINEKYLVVKSYATVSSMLGFAPATIKKYVIPNYISKEEIVIQKFEGSVAPIGELAWLGGPIDWNELLNLTNEEIDELEGIRKEILV